MKKMPFVQGVAKASAVIFNIMSVLSLVGAVALLLAVFSLSVLPAGTLHLSADMDLSVEMKLARVFGDGWEEAVKGTEIPEGAEKTEEGYHVSEAASATLENRGFALALIPLFAEMITLYVFYRALAAASRALAEAPSAAPFSPALAKESRTAGVVLFFLSAGPAVCKLLIGLLTAGKQVFTLGSGEIEFTLILWGFVLLALSYLFEYAVTLQPYVQPPHDVPQAPPASQNPPFGGSH